jgi:hypothetical protein
LPSMGAAVRTGSSNSSVITFIVSDIIPVVGKNAGPYGCVKRHSYRFLHVVSYSTMIS